jgi:hypothetical protein
LVTCKPVSNCSSSCSKINLAMFGPGAMPEKIAEAIGGVRCAFCVLVISVRSALRIHAALQTLVVPLYAGIPNTPHSTRYSSWLVVI